MYTYIYIYDYLRVLEREREGCLDGHLMSTSWVSGSGTAEMGPRRRVLQNGNMGLTTG